MTSKLAQKKCRPCEGGVPPLKGDQLQPFLDQIDDAWEVADEKKIRRQFSFATFPETIKFVNKVAELAEQEGHHPDLHIHYTKLTIELWTHKIDGLFDNDFILAAKIDELYR
jgi:4a-hydroxytetrahydrobiopterin dehydratase